MAQSFKTAISFGLVYVPITLHACIKNNDIAFNTLYKKTGERIHYKKTCRNCPADVFQDDLVRGYQYEKDKYVVLTDKEIEKLKTPKNKSIEIESFVKLNEIDPIYFDKSYYVKPMGAENAFLLILKAIESENKVGIAKTVLGTKEQVVAIRSINGQMILYTMHFFDEIQATPIQQIKEKIKDKELDMAKIIIHNMTSKFEPELYKNDYREKLLNAIEDKIAGKKIQGEDGAIVKPRSIINLMDALKKSISKSSKPKTTKTKIVSKTKVTSKTKKNSKSKISKSA